jgi:hypothetical protein
MKSLFFLIIVVAFFVAPNCSFGREFGGYSGFVSQNRPDTTVLWKQLNVVQDERIDSLLQRHAGLKGGKDKMRGYRIQIFSGAGGGARISAMRVKTSFLGYYPDVNADVIYSTPDFKVRIGGFRTRSEALKFQKKLISEFPNAIIVSDKIDFPELDK